MNFPAVYVCFVLVTCAATMCSLSAMKQREDLAPVLRQARNSSDNFSERSRLLLEAMHDVHMFDVRTSALMRSAQLNPMEAADALEKPRESVCWVREPISFEKIDVFRKMLVRDAFRVWRLFVGLMDYSYDLVLLHNGKLPDDIIVECKNGKPPLISEVIEGVKRGLLARYTLLSEEINLLATDKQTCEVMVDALSRWTLNILITINQKNERNFFEAFARFKVFSASFYQWFELTAILAKNKGRVESNSTDKLSIDRTCLNKMLATCDDAKRREDKDIQGLFKAFQNPSVACDELLKRTLAVDYAITQLEDKNLREVVDFFWASWKQQFAEFCAEISV